MSEIRMGRIEEELKRIISGIIANDLKDPRITSLISVTGVEVSNDLKYANVFVSIFDKKSENEKELQDNVIKILNKSKGYIRTELAHKLTLRYTPELSFKLDNSIVYGSHIEEILNNIVPNNTDNSKQN